MPLVGGRSRLGTEIPTTLADKIMLGATYRRWCWPRLALWVLQHKHGLLEVEARAAIETLRERFSDKSQIGYSFLEGKNLLKLYRLEDDGSARMHNLTKVASLGDYLLSIEKNDRWRFVLVQGVLEGTGADLKHVPSVVVDPFCCVWEPSNDQALLATHADTNYLHESSQDCTVASEHEALFNADVSKAYLEKLHTVSFAVGPCRELHGQEEIARFYKLQEDATADEIASKAKDNDMFEATIQGGDPSRPHACRRRHYPKSIEATARDAGVYSQPTRVAAMGVSLRFDRRDGAFRVRKLHRANVFDKHGAVYRAFAQRMKDMFEEYKDDKVAKAMLKAIYAPFTGKMTRSLRTFPRMYSEQCKVLTDASTCSAQALQIQCMSELMQQFRVIVNGETLASPYEDWLDSTDREEDTKHSVFSLIMHDKAVRRRMPHHYALLRTSNLVQMLQRLDAAHGFRLTLSHTDCLRGAQGRVTFPHRSLRELLSIERTQAIELGNSLGTGTARREYGTDGGKWSQAAVDAMVAQSEKFRAKVLPILRE